MDLNYSQSNWLDLLHPALFSINNSSSSALPGDMTPIQAETGRNPLLPIDTHKAMRRTQVDSTASVEEQVSEITAIHDAVREAITAARQRMKDLADKKRLLWSVLELMVFVGSDRSGGPGRCGASTLALSQLTDLNILEFHTPFKSPCNSLNPQGTIVF